MVGASRQTDSFTHHDPLEDTESLATIPRAGATLGFTHHDPLEDTERCYPVLSRFFVVGFTHHDPLEDTERFLLHRQSRRRRLVSPITIRLRILKVFHRNVFFCSPLVSPITIRLRILKG